MSAVLGLFESQYIKNIPLTVVRPGHQKRSFTNVEDTVKYCIFAYKKKINRQYAVFNKKSISILKLAKLFSKKIKFINQRKGERFNPKFAKEYRGIKIHHFNSPNTLKDYIKNFKTPNN